MQRSLVFGVFALVVGIGCSTTTVVGEPTTTNDPVAPTPDEPVEAGAIDAGDPRCAPRDVSTYEPDWKPPAPRQHVCTDEQLVALASCELGGGKASECARFLTGGPAEDLACKSCVVTRSTAAAWGPVVHTPEKHVFLNMGGCVALLEPDRAQCGEDDRAASGCVAAACLDTCFSDATTSKDSKIACSTAASEGGCQTYVNRDVQCQLEITDAHSPAEICLTTFDDAGFTTVGRAFCGQ